MVAAFLIRFWPHLILALVIGMAGKCAYNAGAESIQSKWDAATLAQHEALQEAHNAAVAKERELNATVQDLEDRLTAAQLANLEEVQVTLSRVHGGELRLRERFTCPDGVPQDTPAPGTDDGAGGGGLSAEDAGILVRESARADRVAHKLAACQAWVRALE